ncbi:MAG TPA: DarT ssDNA thymidine ADP-ribosyltransferase family protein [Clostridiales bacterium]|nr:DarT ssDNA thymidine ADP-ribosyltransferase family protein [Clostridiales bacterium]HQP70465.1 DarT ssDNA thymidine ADP-ribosyltransferase family protein [Clostridiales bacterium]
MPVVFKSDIEAFKDEVERRGINRVVHFTPAINLISIYEQGSILSREQLKKLTVEYPQLHLEDYVEVNDRLRLDNLNDYINLSIQHPNYYLFKKFRNSCKNWCDSWCVISLNPECLWYESTLFSIGNAASSVSKEFGINGKYTTFLSLFQDNLISGNINHQTVLSRKGIKDYHPTDVQAEVLVKGQISTECISEVFFETQEEASRFRAAISLTVNTKLPPFTVNSNLFIGDRNNG